jgi:hypothetical protein
MRCARAAGRRRDPTQQSHRTTYHTASRPAVVIMPIFLLRRRLRVGRFVRPCHSVEATPRHQGYRALSNAAGPQPPHDQQQQLAPRRRRSGCLAFGEIIFDCFGDGSSVVGGAPLNFAVNLQQLGLEVGMVSALGRDQLGAAARSYMGSCGVDAALVHESPRPTGQVNVTIGGDGEARYDVDLEASWSEIHGPGGPPSSFSRPELLYIGSTARQTPHNAAAVRDLVTRLRPVHVFFDLNLRPGLYAPESVSQNG